MIKNCIKDVLMAPPCPRQEVIRSGVLNMEQHKQGLSKRLEMPCHLIRRSSMGRIGETYAHQEVDFVFQKQDPSFIRIAFM